MPFCIKASGLSDKGMVRPHNEDSMVVEPSEGIVVVADGMGGAVAGEVASALAVEETVEALGLGQGMEAAIIGANRKILETATSRPNYAGMGTTISALRVMAQTGAFEVGHVGDSRVYRLHGETLFQITSDHTMVARMVADGALSPEQAEGHPMGHILSQALGTQSAVEVELVLGMAEAGDRFLVCSDGLTRVMEEAELSEWLVGSREEGLDQTVQVMIEEANARGAPDNVTVAVLAVELEH